VFGDEPGVGAAFAGAVEEEDHGPFFVGGGIVARGERDEVFVGDGFGDGLLKRCDGLVLGGLRKSGG